MKGMKLAVLLMLAVPAIVNAIGDALAPLGVTVTSMPLGPNDIFELIHAQK